MDSTEVFDLAERLHADQEPPAPVLTHQETLERSIVGFEDFLKMDIPERPLILSPWLRPGTITLLSAPRGIGKTFFCDIVALSVTRKLNIGPWTVENPAGVLYLDGEMPGKDRQDRLAALSQGLPPILAPFCLLNSDLMRKNNLPTPNLCNPEWRESVYNILKTWGTFKLLILDNISSLCPGLDENSKQDWDAINQWLLKIRFLDVGVIIVHHTGKGGDQRGTSGREDNIDVSIKLTRPPGYSPEEGAQFNVEFTKSRGVHGRGVEPFILQVIERDGRLTWATEKPGEKIKNEIIAMLGQGVPQKDIPSMLKCSRAWVSRVKGWAVQKAYLDSRGKFTTKGAQIFGDMDIECFL